MSNEAKQALVRMLAKARLQWIDIEAGREVWIHSESFDDMMTLYTDLYRAVLQNRILKVA